MELVKKNYNELLGEITQYLQGSKVTISWNIGKILFKYSADNISIEQLSKDLNMSPTNLFRMLNFYKTYPNSIPQNNLNWSQYSVLSEIKDAEFRDMLEDKTITEKLTVEELKKEIREKKIQEPIQEIPTEPIEHPKILKPNRGMLYNYKLAKPYEHAKICLDLGFFIFREIPLNEYKNNEENILNFVKNEDVLEVTKSADGKYFVKKASASVRKIHTYKAYLKNIVDGDTIKVVLDLGFEIYREEILRLKDVYASELGTKEGSEHKKILEKILRDVDVVVLRTYQFDMYKRYVCDLFYDKNEKDAQKIANSGKYLNQQLVDIFR
jgi:micrococcal nuclease